MLKLLNRHCVPNSNCNKHVYLIMNNVQNVYVAHPHTEMGPGALTERSAHSSSAQQLLVYVCGCDCRCGSVSQLYGTVRLCCISLYSLPSPLRLPSSLTLPLLQPFLTIPVLLINLFIFFKAVRVANEIIDTCANTFITYLQTNQCIPMHGCTMCEEIKIFAYM